MDMEKVINELVEHIESALAVDSDYVDCVRTDLLQTVVGLLKEQQPKTGHWLKKMSNNPSAIAMGGSRTSTCDSCGGWGRKTFKYCPHCGAKMTG